MNYKDQKDRVSTFRQLGSFLVDWSRLVLTGDLNAILDTNVGRRLEDDGASGDMIDEFAFAGIYGVDHTASNMWTWALS